MRNILLTLLLFFKIGTNVLLAQNCSINAGINATICQKDTMILNGTRSGLLGSNSISTWTQTAGSSVIISTPNSLNTKVFGFSAGVYKFRLSIKCKDGYFAEDSVNVTVLPLTLADAGRDTTFCPVGQSLLNGNTPHNGETGLWAIVSANNAGVTINSVNNPRTSITLNPNVSGITTLRWTITNSNSCVSFDEVVITNCGGVPIVYAGPDQVLGNCFSNTTCANLSASNGGVGLGGQKGVWSFVSGPSVPTVSTPISPTTKVCNLIQGTYVFRYTVTGPCANGFDDVSIVVPPPTQDITIANSNTFSLNTSYCGIVNTLSLNGNPPLYTGETVLWTQTSGPTVTISNPTSSSATINGVNAYGTYCFNYSIINSTSRCISSSIVCYTLYSNGTVDGV